MGAEAVEQLDVLVIGAGISGINAAYYLKTERPDHSFAVLEALESYGGTWLTHTYPGIRSDTELYTLAFSFKPWTHKPYADGAQIRDYLGEAIAEFGIAPHVRYGHQVTSASWSSEAQRWRVRGTRGGEAFELDARFLWMCHGYYRQAEGYRPHWPGEEDFAGTFIHPQTWPADPGIAGKNVVVIGSGATMATLVPNIADECAHVTVLQRSPTYFFMSPNCDELADELRAKGTPEPEIHEQVRAKAVAEMQAMTAIQKEHPEMSRDGLIAMVATQLPEGYDVATHFTPRHLPHEQRVCRILDGDLFKAISDGKVTMVTDEIDHFTKDGITTRGGTGIEADVVITATGFNLSVLGDVAFDLDGEAVDFANHVTYRGILFSEVPNLAWTFGALRLSWTMRAEMVNRFVVRMLSEMDERGEAVVTAQLRDEDQGMALTDFVPGSDFNPGYLQRARHLMPRSGDKPEWQLSLDYWAEADILPNADLRDGCLRFEVAQA